jgi:N-acetyl-gamma-glutamylphosphate reductase
MTVPAVVLGATGYVGGEFLRLLGTHPVFRLAAAVSDSRGGGNLALFSAAPHGASAPGIAAALEGAGDRGLDVHVVDSSADFMEYRIRRRP